MAVFYTGISHRSRQLGLLLIAMLSLITAQAQLSVQAQPLGHLVNDVFLGEGVRIVSVRYIGHSAAIGYFDGRRSNIGLDSGLILSTGRITDAPGPNDADNTTTQFGTPGDAVLSQIAGDQTFDASILEIELIPQSDTLRFRYVFASEEYPEFVGQFNDAFAMFISGPGISGMQNIALVPGASIPVTVNNVNNGNTNTGPCINCQYYIDNTNGATVEFNGFTRVFTAIARVTPCQTYKLRIAIADTGDERWDSGVFLEAKSLRSNTYDIRASVKFDQAINNRNDSTLYEECGTVSVRIKREGKLTQREVVKLRILGTATQGIDYENFPDSVVFQPGQAVVSFEFKGIADLITDDNETIRIELVPNLPCPLDTAAADLIIREFPKKINLGPDTRLCPGDSLVLTAPFLPNVNYEWQNGSTGRFMTVKEPGGTYWVKITNDCNISVRDTITVQYYPMPTLDLGRDTAICEGTHPVLRVHSFPFAVYSWNNGSNDTTITVQDTGWYSLTLTTPCTTLVERVHIRYVDKLNIYLGPDTAICEDEVLDYNLYARDITNYHWQDGSTSPEYKINKPGKYWVTVNTVCEFTSDTVNVTYLTKARFDLGNDTVFCDEFTLRLDAGPSGVSYLWSPDGQTSRSIIVHDYGTYSVALTNVNGCVTRDSMSVLPLCPPVVHIPNAFTPTGDGLNEGFKPVTMFVLSCDFSVYNRWGEKIFHTTDVNGTWDGTYRGVQCPQGVYYYIYQYRGLAKKGSGAPLPSDTPVRVDRAMKTETLSGTITLLR